jgi:hypothetical protein
LAGKTPLHDYRKGAEIRERAVREVRRQHTDALNNPSAEYLQRYFRDKMPFELMIAARRNVSLKHGGNRRQSVATQIWVNT